MLIPSAIALTLVTTAEGLLVSRVLRREAPLPHEPEPRPVRLRRSATSPPAPAAASRSARRRRARRRWTRPAPARSCPSLVLAVGTLLLLLFGTALLADIPSPAIGAIVGVAILPLLGIREFAQLWRADRFEFAHRRGVLPRHAVRRLDPRHRRGVRARPHQPRQAGGEPRDRRARVERRTHRLAARRSADGRP